MSDPAPTATTPATATAGDGGNIKTPPAAPAAAGAVPTPAPAPKFKEYALKDLDPRLQKYIEQADKAVDKNPQNAIDLCTGILAQNPGALDARKVLRKAQRKLIPSQKGMGKFLSGLTNTPFVLKSGSQIKTDPKGVIDAAEKLLSINPANVQALRMEGQAAEAMGLWGTAALAYENIREIKPEDIENLLSLGTSLIHFGQPKEAIKWGEMILEIQPGNGDAQALLRQASVAITMDKGKWDEQSDFRSKLADANKAAELEQQSRLANDPETLGRLVTKLADTISREPENINLYRDIIGYLRQLQRFEEALEWVRKARQQPLGRSDTTLEKLESDMTVSMMRVKLEALEAIVATDPSRKTELDALRKSDLEFRVQQAKTLVEKYPNDYGYRFDYGTLLFETGQMDLSIRELQQARRNPKVSHKAMLYLGRAYRAKKIYDLAIEVLSTARTEMPVMNDLKKEIIYELAQCFRGNGNIDKAVEEYKNIYANDIDYKDVSKIINEYYEKKTLE
jgi:tetratricopeptide (TPR) repeat protein